LPTALKRERIRLPETGRLAAKAFLVDCLAAIVLAAASCLVLNDAQEPVDRAFATPPYTRVGD
jgi:hypothetical protein